MKTEKEIIREQEKYIQEMGHYISILEEANAQQKQTIEMLEQHNTVLQQHYEQITTLQYRCRCLSKQVEDFKSGEKYRQMEKAYKELLRFHNKEVKRPEYELSKAHSETVTVRKYWDEVMDDFEKEHGKEVCRLQTIICPGIITWKDIICFCGCKNIKKTNFFSCMIKGCRQTILCVKDWHGFFNENRNRQSLCEAMKI